MSNPLIWAHRGASGHAPENTLPSFKLAADMKADGVELDIQLTKDDVIVVCHDEKIDRTSTGAGFIKDYTYDELLKYDFCNGNLAFEGTKIPTMEEVFELLDPTGLTINIELKTGEIFYPDLEEKIVALTKKKGFQDRVIYSSFNHYSVMKIKEIDPDAKVGFLYADGPLNMPGYAAENEVNALHPAFYNLQYPDFMADCDMFGIDVNVWTVNSESALLRCRELGVNAVITNYPDKARKIYEQN
ncbi:glycerophosphodiester phosphodiesterase [Butyrivibrio sp. VCD2006]|uniref:glycerophosphodiester phosphodiesterase n=1 Tax=Butyrivibrio sp. VCD2006 TaxID=1280664 RepID=UPI00056B1882|nr:glycerophosphodiester phosphodiesterase [Butyrivibrio sp. VCD2006]